MIGGCGSPLNGIRVQVEQSQNSLIPICLKQMLQKKSSGFTLMELMVTIAIAAVLAGLAVPSIRDFLMRQRMTGIADDFSASLLKARSEAANRNVCTSMCMSSNTGATSPTCATTGTDWQQGWIAFLNTDCDGSKTNPAQSDVFLIRESIGSSYLLQTQSTVRIINFNPQGNSTLNSTSEFDIVYNTVNSAETVKYGFNICLDAMGRTRNITNDKTCSNY